MDLPASLCDSLSTCRHLLIAGMGGGFDVYCGLPLYFELRKRGKTAFLANFSFTNTRFIHDAVVLDDGGCIGVTPESRTALLYAPEVHLARFLNETVWCLKGEAVLHLTAAYRALIAHLGIDGIILIDGGVDSLSRGSEPKPGTIMEDWQSLAAVRQLSEVPLRWVATLGFGAENDVSLDAIRANVTDLQERGAFLAAAPLSLEMSCVQRYEEAVAFAHSQRGQDASAINASILASLYGMTGDFHATEKTIGTRLSLSPLTHEYWFFELEGLAACNPHLPALTGTFSRLEMMTYLSYALSQR